MKRDDPRHGTYAGYQIHRREGKRPCKPCAEARNAYMRKFRDGNEREKERVRAVSQAIQRLIDTHRDDYERFYLEARTQQRNAKLIGASK